MAEGYTPVADTRMRATRADVDAAGVKSWTRTTDRGTARRDVAPDLSVPDTESGVGPVVMRYRRPAADPR
mgnify:CR=1 FL=1